MNRKIFGKSGPWSGLLFGGQHFSLGFEGSDSSQHRRTTSVAFCQSDGTVIAAEAAAYQTGARRRADIFTACLLPADRSRYVVRARIRDKYRTSESRRRRRRRRRSHNWLARHLIDVSTRDLRTA